jgi:hypothetical protein
MQALFEQPRLIDDEYSLGIAHMLDQRGPQVLPDLIGIPLRPSSQMLDAIRRGIPMDFGHVPSVFALDRTQHTPERRPGPATGFTAGKTWQNAAFYFGQPYCPGTHRL